MLPPLGPTGRLPRKTFSVTIPDNLSETFHKFINQEQFTSEPQAALALIQIALTAVAPGDVVKGSAQAKAYNETRFWIMQQVGQSLVAVKRIMDEEIRKYQAGEGK